MEMQAMNQTPREELADLITMRARDDAGYATAYAILVLADVLEGVGKELADISASIAYISDNK
jgi:hypothetical protein